MFFESSTPFMGWKIRGQQKKQDKTEICVDEFKAARHEKYKISELIKISSGHSDLLNQREGVAGFKIQEEVD